MCISVVWCYFFTTVRKKRGKRNRTKSYILLWTSNYILTALCFHRIVETEFIARGLRVMLDNENSYYDVPPIIIRTALCLNNYNYNV